MQTRRINILRDATFQHKCLFPGSFGNFQIISDIIFKFQIRLGNNFFRKAPLGNYVKN